MVILLRYADFVRAISPGIDVFVRHQVGLGAVGNPSDEQRMSRFAKLPSGRFMYHGKQRLSNTKQTTFCIFDDKFSFKTTETMALWDI